MKINFRAAPLPTRGSGDVETDTFPRARDSDRGKYISPAAPTPSGAQFRNLFYFLKIIALGGRRIYDWKRSRRHLKSFKNFSLEKKNAPLGQFSNLHKFEYANHKMTK